MSSTLIIKRFIVLGDAGAGKSSFINFLFNYYNGTNNPDEIFCEHPKVKIVISCANWIDCLDEKYKNNKSERNINDQTQSQTQLCTTYTVSRRNDIRLELIDTPGFNDTNGTDVDIMNLAMIEKALKEVPFLSGIIIVVNGSSPRLGVSFKNFLHMLHQIWPNDLMNNCVAILTNCDELSVNLDSSVLERDLNVDKSKKFHLQNSLFRWNRKLEPKKTIRRFQQDFEENLETIKLLLSKIPEFENVSTKSFSVGAIKISLIEKCINQSIHNMLDLLEKYKEQQVAEAGIEGARDTMENNKQWEKQHEIHAIRWVEVPQDRSPSPKRSQYRQPQKVLHNEQQRMQSQDQGSNKSKLNVSGERRSGYSDKSDPLRSDPKVTTSKGGKPGSKTISNNTSSSDHSHPSEIDGSYHRPEAEGLQYDPRSGISLYGSRVGEPQYGMGVGGLQYGTRVGGSQPGIGCSGSPYGPGSGGSPYGTGVGESQPGMGYSGTPYGPGSGGSSYGTRVGGSQPGMGYSGTMYGPGTGGSPYGRGVGGSQPGIGPNGSQYGTETDGPNYSGIDNRKYKDYDMHARYNDENGRHDAHSKKSLLGSCFGFGDSEGKYLGFSHRPVYQQQQTKIQVTLPDNEARAQHKYAERQENSLKKRTQYLADEKQFLKSSLMSQLEHLRKQVAELRSINKKYDIIERNHDLLISFKDIIKYMGDDSDMLSYYNDTVAILSNN